MPKAVIEVAITYEEDVSAEEACGAIAALLEAEVDAHHYVSEGTVPAAFDYISAVDDVKLGHR